MLIRKDDSEREILEFVANGDESAFKMLFERYQHKVYGYAFRIIHDEAAAEEVVQDVFLKIWLKKAELRAVENFGAYLRTMSRNHTLNIWKKNLATIKTNLLHTENWTEGYDQVEEEISYKDTLKIVHQALENLPPQQKQIYYMCRIEGIKPEEVAIQLNISKNTVKAHLQQAGKTMRSYLSGHNELMGVLVLLSLFKSI